MAGWGKRRGLWGRLGGRGWVYRAIWKEERVIMGGSCGDEGIMSRVGRDWMVLLGDLEGGGYNGRIGRR